MGESALCFLLLQHGSNMKATAAQAPVIADYICMMLPSAQTNMG